MCALLLLGSVQLPAAEIPAAEIPPVDGETFERTIQPLLKKHCVRCHGAEKQEAQLRLDQLSPDMLASKTASLWHELINRVNSGEMPPESAGELSGQELTQLSAWVFAELKRVQAAAENTGGRVVIRRLNRQEYNNTIRDLVGIPFDAGAEFPADPAAHGFDNIGSALSISPLHMEKYLKAARKVIDRAIVTGPQPKRERWRFQAERRSPESRGYYYENDEQYGNTGVLPPGAVRGRRILWALGGGVDFFPDQPGFEHLPPVEKTRFRSTVLRGIGFQYQHPGEYIIRVRAYGHYPDREMSSHHIFGPPRLNVTSNGMRVFACDVAATSDAPQVYEHRFYTEAVETNLYIRNRYDLSLNLIENTLGKRMSFRSPEFPYPYLAIDWYEVDGPVYDQWPPESHTRILFPSEKRNDETAYAREVLTAFAAQAFRRPVTSEEVDRLVSVFAQARPGKASFEEAIKVPLIAVLCSPSFLFLAESLPDESGEARPLTVHELASRLSYFLWSSQPDADLRQLADSGKLHNPGVLDQQVERMLADPKSQAFVDNFAGQWLQLRKLGEVTPDERLFPRYGEHLEEAMAGEALSFFAEVLQHDLSVMNFIASDFAMLNERIARFYEIPGVQGDNFRRVPLRPEHHRGGLLTQAAMLSMTSNGTRTSPVKRGMWILENILGDPPPPPPPDAGEIPPPKVPGPSQATVRQRLAVHRSVAACAACHAKIDPLGFALEHYDASGLFREKESSRNQLNPHPKDPLVDATGELPDGRQFDGVEELQQILLTEEEKFLDCLSEKLFTYALGRGLEYSDRATVTQLRESLQQNDYHLRGLITEIVKTKAFQTK